jgi:aspartate racemase
MKTVGIVGGIGPESTVDYYRSIIALYRAKHDPANYPPLLINSINLTEIKGYIEVGRLDRMIAILVEAIGQLARAGAGFIVLGANTAHLVFDEVQSQSPLPIVSIVDCTCRRAREMALRRVALLGTGFTMQSDFFPKGFAKEGLETVVPSKEEQAFIHRIIFDELQDGIVKAETRDRLLTIVHRMQQDHAIDSIALACTELPLILKPDDPAITLPLLNTVEIHVERIVQTMVSS